MPVGDVGERRETVLRDVFRIDLVADQERVNADCGEDEEQRGKQTARAATPERAQRDAGRSVPLVDEQARDEEAAEDEEQVDAQEPAWSNVRGEVIENHGDDRDTAQPVERAEVGHTRRTRGRRCFRDWCRLGRCFFRPCRPLVRRGNRLCCSFDKRKRPTAAPNRWLAGRRRRGIGSRPSFDERNRPTSAPNGALTLASSFRHSARDVTCAGRSAPAPNEGPYRPSAGSPTCSVGARRAQRGFAGTTWAAPARDAEGLAR